jgi:hypothetical protein
LDCDQIADRLKPVRVQGDDPFRLDADRDGLGCETGAEGGGLRSRYGLILRSPPRKKRRVSPSAGRLPSSGGWSPKLAKGTRYKLCSAARCVGLSSYVLKGTAPQTFGKWRVTRGDVRSGLVKISLKVGLRVRASDTVSIR